MSDHWILLIPENPSFIPERHRQLSAEAYFRELAPNADEIESDVTDGIEFVNCGSNFEKISCPHCGTHLDIPWWHSAMDKDYDDNTGFHLSEHRLPCCGETTTLHDLDYDWPQGFARYSLSAMNASVGRLDEEQIARFESLLGCKIRVIYQHL